MTTLGVQGGGVTYRIAAAALGIGSMEGFERPGRLIRDHPILWGRPMTLGDDR